MVNIRLKFLNLPSSGIHPGRKSLRPESRLSLKWKPNPHGLSDDIEFKKSYGAEVGVSKQMRKSGTPRKSHQHRRTGGSECFQER